MRIERLDAAAQPAAVRALYGLYRAGAAADAPGQPPMSGRVFGELLVQGWCTEPRETWLAWPGVGGYTLELPDRENRDRAYLSVLAGPGHRRRGLGTALFRHALARARDLGRTTVGGDTIEGTPASAFTRAMGATAELAEARRVLALRGIPAGRLGELRASAKAAAAGYALRDWSGPAPEDCLGEVARLNETMHDAPHSAGEQAQAWDAERVRESGRLAARMGLRHYSVAAQQEATGELAGLTELAVDPADPGWGHQEMTVVARAHRGHRLGLLLKVAMLELLAEREPQLETIQTYNAESNAHMVSINETLGHRVAGRLTAWQLRTGAGGPARPRAGAAAGAQS